MVALLVAITQMYPLAQRMALWLLPSVVVLLAGCLSPARAGAEVGAPAPCRLAPRLRAVKAVAGGAAAAMLTVVLLIPSSGSLSLAFVAPGRWLILSALKNSADRPPSPRARILGCFIRCRCARFWRPEDCVWAVGRSGCGALSRLVGHSLVFT